MSISTPQKPTTRRIVGMVVGIVIIGLGIALFKQSHLGNDSISALNMRLAELLGISLIFDEENWVSWVLPVFSMSLGNIAYYAMWLRRYMVDESTKDYVQLAKIKGVSSNRIMFTHIFRNAFVPMAQYIPTSFLNTVVGSIYIESLYSIPGMGGLLVDVVKKQDNNMVQGIVLVFACVGVVGLIFGDLLMVLLDPRISFGSKGGNR